MCVILLLTVHGICKQAKLLMTPRITLTVLAVTAPQIYGIKFCTHTDFRFIHRHWHCMRLEVSSEEKLDAFLDFLRVWDIHHAQNQESVSRIVRVFWTGRISTLAEQSASIRSGPLLWWRNNATRFTAWTYNATHNVICQHQWTICLSRLLKRRKNMLLARNMGDSVFYIPDIR